LRTTVLLPLRWKNGCRPSMPESMIATELPAPPMREVPSSALNVVSATSLRVAWCAVSSWKVIGWSPSTARTPGCVTTSRTCAGVPIATTMPEEGPGLLDRHAAGLRGVRGGLDRLAADHDAQAVGAALRQLLSQPRLQPLGDRNSRPGRGQLTSLRRHGGRRLGRIHGVGEQREQEQNGRGQADGRAHQAHVSSKDRLGCCPFRPGTPRHLLRTAWQSGGQAQPPPAVACRG
jgi:hypothetical protein